MIFKPHFRYRINTKLCKARRRNSNIKGLKNREQDGMNTLGLFYKEDKLYFCKKILYRERANCQRNKWKRTR